MLGNAGALVEWSGHVGPGGVSSMHGRRTTVNGRPALVQTVHGRPCGVPVDIINGLIRESGGDYLYMHATVAAEATSQTREDVMQLFETATP